MKREITSHFFILLVWLILVTLLRWDWGWYLVPFWVGGAIGTVLLDIDQLFHALIIYPEAQAKELLQKKQYKNLFAYLAQTARQRTRLLCHNAVFQVIFFVFCFWALISTNSWFGKGMVMGMSLHLLKDEFHLLLNKKEDFLNQLLFWPLKKPVFPKEQKLFVILMAITFLLLSTLLI